MNIALLPSKLSHAPSNSCEKGTSILPVANPSEPVTAVPVPQVKNPGIFQKATIQGVYWQHHPQLLSHQVRFQGLPVGQDTLPALLSMAIDSLATARNELLPSSGKVPRLVAVRWEERWNADGTDNGNDSLSGGIPKSQWVDGDHPIPDWILDYIKHGGGHNRRVTEMAFWLETPDGKPYILEFVPAEGPWEPLQTFNLRAMTDEYGKNGPLTETKLPHEIDIFDFFAPSRFEVSHHRNVEMASRMAYGINPNSPRDYESVEARGPYGTFETASPELGYLESYPAYDQLLQGTRGLCEDVLKSLGMTPPPMPSHNPVPLPPHYYQTRTVYDDEE